MKVQLFLLLIVFGCSSCYHKFYSPITNNVPTHNAKNELAITGGYYVNEEIDAYELQVAYSITDHIGAIGNVAYSGMKDRSSFSSGNGFVSDVGLGYFLKSNNLYGSVYGGVGISQQNHFFNDGGSQFEKIDINYFNVFAQPSIGISLDYFEVLMSVRMSFVNYNTIDNTLNPYYNTRFSEELNKLNESNPYFLYQPSITFRGGLPNLKIQSQIGFVDDLKNQKFYYDYYFSGGIVYIFGRKNYW